MRGKVKEKIRTNKKEETHQKDGNTKFHANFPLREKYNDEKREYTKVGRSTKARPLQIVCFILCLDTTYFGSITMNQPAPQTSQGLFGLVH